MLYTLLITVFRGRSLHSAKISWFHSNKKSQSELPLPLESPSESMIHENQSLPNIKKETKTKPTRNGTQLDTIVVKDVQPKPKPEKPELRVRPTVVKQPIVTKKPDADGYSTAKSDATGEDNQYYNAMARSRKVLKGGSQGLHYNGRGKQ